MTNSTKVRLFLESQSLNAVQEQHEYSQARTEFDRAIKIMKDAEVALP